MNEKLLALEAQFKLDMNEFKTEFLNKKIYTAEEYLQKKNVLESSFKYHSLLLKEKY